MPVRMSPATVIHFHFNRSHANSIASHLFPPVVRWRIPAEKDGAIPPQIHGGELL